MFVKLSLSFSFVFKKNILTSMYLLSFAKVTTRQVLDIEIHISEVKEGILCI